MKQMSLTAAFHSSMLIDFCGQEKFHIFEFIFIIILFALNIVLGL